MVVETPAEQVMERAVQQARTLARQLYGDEDLAANPSELRAYFTDLCREFRRDGAIEQAKESVRDFKWPEGALNRDSDDLSRLDSIEELIRLRQADLRPFVLNEDNVRTLVRRGSGVPQTPRPRPTRCAGRNPKPSHGADRFRFTRAHALVLTTALGVVEFNSHKGSRSCLDSRTLLGSSSMHSHKGSCFCLDSRTWCESSSIHTRAHALVLTPAHGADQFD